MRLRSLPLDMSAKGNRRAKILQVGSRGELREAEGGGLSPNTMAAA